MDRSRLLRRTTTLMDFSWSQWCFQSHFCRIKKEQKAERKCAIAFYAPQMSFLFLPKVKGRMLFHLQVQFLKIQLAFPVAMATKRQAAFKGFLQAAFTAHQQTNHLWVTSFSSDTWVFSPGCLHSLLTAVFFTQYLTGQLTISCLRSWAVRHKA